MMAGVCLFVRAVVIVSIVVLGDTSLAYAQAWPNEPSGSTLISDHSFTTRNADGWIDYSDIPIVQDTGGPLSPPDVASFNYPIGFPGGGSPGQINLEGLNLSDIYVGFWWQVSKPWQGHTSLINKILYIFTSPGGHLIPIMYGANGGPYHLRLAPQWTDTWTWLTPNVNDVLVTLGVWHRIEIYAKRSTTTTSADGIIRWWMDGTLLGEYTKVNFDGTAAQNWYGVSVNPTWGGNGDVKTENDYFRFDHIRVSRPSPNPLTAPSSLKVTAQ